ncbi:S9 family peptidase [Novipirellula sp. SH528]|uniref:S9 family peptidase n=1 Tax=Novipirellula sp. SH528 TaxID=3454466 RepID=UPI003F9F25FF
MMRKWLSLSMFGMCCHRGTHWMNATSLHTAKRCLCVAGNMLGSLLAIGMLQASGQQIDTSHSAANHLPDQSTSEPGVNMSTLSLDQIVGSDELSEDQPPALIWSGRSDSYFTLEKSEEIEDGVDVIQVDIADGTKQTVVPAEALIPNETKTPLAIDGFQFSADESKLLIFTNSKRVWRRNTRGDYWVLDVATQKLDQLGGDAAPSTLMFAKFSPDNRRVAYVCNNNLFVQEIDSLQISQLTHDGSTETINGTSDWVNEEELAIRDAYRWSPDGETIAFWQFDTTGVGRFHLIDNTRGIYPEITSFPYPKVGQTNSATRSGVVRIDSGSVTWLDVPGHAREHYLPQMEWTPDGHQILLQQMNRLQNTNRVMLANAENGKTQTVFTETETTWLENENPVRWIDNGNAYVWLSERDGWRHAYRVSRDGQQVTKITDGDYDVLQIEAIDVKAGWLYFAASPENPTQCYLYRVRLDGSDLERLSPADQPGWHTYAISDDCRWAVHTYSTFNIPPVVKLIKLEDHSPVRVLHDNAKLRDRLAELNAPTSEFFRVDIGDGLQLDAWCLKPPQLDETKKYPLLVHVYGEPHGQTVKDVWQGARGLWHAMLAQQGYVVVSIDNRGTRSPRGRDWRKCIYRKIGMIAPEEQAAAVRGLLAKWSYLDSKRVGVWGWSGGGSMSLNAIFRYPELYSTAIAVAPNANQLLYDSIYQERYMGLPDDNAEGYRLGSPITYASQLEGNLLIVHGTGDDNGHYQGTEYLINELIAEDKRFSVMPYPARSHAINEGTNTVRHFYSVLTDYLNDHLAGPSSDD